MVRTVGLSLYYQTVQYIRIKEAFFFVLVFPIFLFVVFSNLWGALTADYIPRLLTGVIAMSVASDGLFSIGYIAKSSIGTGLIKILNKRPEKVLAHYGGIALSHIFMLTLVSLVLHVVAFIFFNIEITLSGLLYTELGIIAGITLFAMMGLVITFIDPRPEAGRGWPNFVQFTLLFSSEAFYSVEALNETLFQFANLLPFNHILYLMRGEDPNWWILAGWMGASTAAFFILFNRFQVKRA
ncbi:MAG: ABC transporter permease [Bacteroidota bacterium]